MEKTRTVAISAALLIGCFNTHANAGWSGPPPLSNWMSEVNGDLPFDAVAGGIENGLPLYICRANYPSVAPTGLYAGKTRPGWQSCQIPYYGKAPVVKTNYDVLVAAWQTDVAGNVPPNAHLGLWYEDSMERPNFNTSVGPNSPTEVRIPGSSSPRSAAGFHMAVRHNSSPYTRFWLT
jgi:Protein of unknown function (DUF3421)